MASDTVILVFYFGVMALLAVFGLHRYKMVYLYSRHRGSDPAPGDRFSEDDLPTVTVQLPFYNELYVVERLIDRVCELDYPRDRLQIQVLDDSTDETVELARAKVDAYHALGVDIEYRHRTNRRGYKAGALEEGLAHATGELIVIYDADFAPQPDALRNLVHYFTDPQIGMVQSRWGHINLDYSLLTQFQGIFLDGHFVIEQTARNRSGRYFNFNGTAGMWRRTTIEDAGGWEHDTLTEDMDLSYRAQLRGWRFIFLKDEVSPAELPADINAFKSQQHRWTKGTVQVARKILGRIWASDSPLKCKIEATFHLSMGASYVLMIAMTLMMLPAMTVRLSASWVEALVIDLPLFMAATVSVFSFYFYSQRETYPGAWLGKVKHLPMLIALGIGMMFSNAKAWMEGLLGHESEFVRTPKHRIEGKSGAWRGSKYRGTRNLLPLVELTFGVYMLLTWVLAYQNGRYLALPFVTLFVAGFFYVGCLSIGSLRGAPRADADAPAAAPAAPVAPVASVEVELVS